MSNQGYKVDLKHFLETELNLKFDNFLYNIVGYDILTPLTVGLFYSPYAATSLREYFANGFEAIYYDREMSRLSKVSPTLASKIKQLILTAEEEEY